MTYNLYNFMWFYALLGGTFILFALWLCFSILKYELKYWKKEKDTHDRKMTKNGTRD